MARTPDGPPPPPVVQRVRLRYAKRDRLRFTSHRDFQRALERALRRMNAPMAYSAGFSPHPKISYAGAAPTGAASEAEYVELGLAERVDLDEFVKGLDAALPPGLDVLEAVEFESGSLAERLQGSHWRIELPGVEPATAAAAVADLLALPEIEVSRMTKAGQRTFDVRGAIVVLRTEEPQGTGSASTNGYVGVAQGQPVPCAILHLVVQHTTPAVRPDDVLTALKSRAVLAPPSPPRMTRLVQGPLDISSGTVADPLTADRTSR